MKLRNFRGVNCLLSLVLILILLFFSIKYLDMNYIPTVQQINKILPEFIINDILVEGLYGNQDIDALIFKYTIGGSLKSIDNVLSEIFHKAGNNGWKIIERNQEFSRLERFVQKDKFQFFSSEIIKIAIIAETSTIYVAWLQVDSDEKVGCIEDTGEWNWAKQALWPRFEAYINQETQGS